MQDSFTVPMLRFMVLATSCTYSCQTGSWWPMNAPTKIVLSYSNNTCSDETTE
jgi:hypothetical protein